jgi:hypothetical protein
MLGMWTSWIVTEVSGWICASFIVPILDSALRGDFGGGIGGIRGVKKGREGILGWRLE